MMASSSAMTTRVAKGVPFGRTALLARLGLGHEPVEQLVLVTLQLCDLVGDLGLVAAHRLGVALGLAVVDVGDRRLGQGPGLGGGGAAAVRQRLRVPCAAMAPDPWGIDDGSFDVDGACHAT